MKKRNVVVWILVAALVISGISNIILVINYPQPSTSRDPDTLVVGIAYNPSTLEIVNTRFGRDHVSNNILGQIVETLFTNDLTDPKLPRINLLAESHCWENTTTLHIKLREGILFHDGTPFNATAVKWNFDRLQYLINATGTNDGEVADTRSLWMRPDEKTPIINNTAITGNYNITLTLNGAYGPFLSMLTNINTGMISPTTHMNDTSRFISLNTENLVGTGPFIYGHYIPNVEVVLSRWEGYWSHIAYFNRLQFAIFRPVSVLRDAMLHHQIDYLMYFKDEFIPAFEADESIILKRFTDDTGLPSLNYYLLEFNTIHLNETWRKALSYAINYSYIFNEMKEGWDLRGTSPISPSFGALYNTSVKTPEYNITKAREVMVSMGFGDMGWSDEQWITSIFAELGYYPYYHSDFEFELELKLIEWYRLIGVSFCGWLDVWPFEFFEALDFYWMGYAPDFFDPFSMLYRLNNYEYLIFSYECVTYYVPPLNDTWINTKLELVLETSDDEARDEIYKDIQWYFAEKLYPHAFAWHPKIFFVHSADLRGVPYNAMEKFQGNVLWRAENL